MARLLLPLAIFSSLCQAWKDEKKRPRGKKRAYAHAMTHWLRQGHVVCVCYLSVLGEIRFGWHSNASFCCHSRTLAARLPGHVRLGLVGCQKCCGFFRASGVAAGSYLMQSPDALSFFNAEGGFFL